MDALRARGLKIGLVSNTARDLEGFVRHFGVPADAWISSGTHGWVKPSPTIFRAALELLEVEPAAAVMIGDSLADDVEGARALGMRALLLDREGRYADLPDKLTTLLELPAALGLPRDAA
jgi:putative hydrolase of the HAD superfamily